MGEITKDNEYQIIFPGRVIDNKDPMVLGRIRAIPEKIVDFEAMIKAVNFNEEKDKWTSKDPFIFLPLLPFYTSFVPLENEYVHIVFQNKKFKFQNQFYIPGIFSSPMASKFENYFPASKFLAAGDLVATSLSLKDSDGKYADENSKGIFPEPGDNAILGRGSTDIILKADEVLIRAGKTNSLTKNEFPQANNTRAFIQLSNFTQRIIDLPEETEIIQDTKVVFVKKMIVWDIMNLENTENKFTGSVKLYDIIPDSADVNSDNFNIESITKLSDGTNYSYTGIFEDFMAKSVEETGIIINKFIEGVFKGFIESKNTNITEQFPFVVTPSKLTYNIGNKFDIQDTNDVTELTNYVSIFSKIKLNKGIAQTGFFLISEDRSGTPVVGVQPEIKFVTKKPQEIIPEPITYGVMGAQKLVFISHDVAPGPKGKVDIENTIYGISQELFTRPDQNILSQTYPTVRGDQLIILLRKIMAFVSGHVHPIATMPPIPVSAGNGQTTSEIDFILANAENGILNQNIRIN